MDIMCSVDMLGADNAKRYLENGGTATDKKLFDELFGYEGGWRFTSSIDPDVRIGYYVSDKGLGEEEAKALGNFIQRACRFPVLEAKLFPSRTVIEIDPDGIADDMEVFDFPINRVA